MEVRAWLLQMDEQNASEYESQQVFKQEQF